MKARKLFSGLHLTTTKQLILSFCVNLFFQIPNKQIVSNRRNKTRVGTYVQSQQKRQSRLMLFFYSGVNIDQEHMFLGNIYLFQVSNKSNRLRCKICAKLTSSHQNDVTSGVFIYKFEHISHMVLVFRILSLSMYIFARDSKRESKINSSVQCEFIFANCEIINVLRKRIFASV